MFLFVCVVTYMFKAIIAKQLSNKIKNAIYSWWNPVHFMFKTHVKLKQLLTFFFFFTLYYSREQFFFCFWKISAVHYKFTRTVHVHVNSNFKKKKTSVDWIKFTHIVISILLLIIFYLILLHAQKIMKIVLLVGWILYVMKL
jgi:hypothetical protein